MQIAVACSACAVLSISLANVAESIGRMRSMQAEPEVAPQPPVESGSKYDTASERASQQVGQKAGAREQGSQQTGQTIVANAPSGRGRNVSAAPTPTGPRVLPAADPPSPSGPTMPRLPAAPSPASPAQQHSMQDPPKGPRNPSNIILKIPAFNGVRVSHPGPAAYLPAVPAQEAVPPPSDMEQAPPAPAAQPSPTKSADNASPAAAKETSKAARGSG